MSLSSLVSPTVMYTVICHYLTEYLFKLSITCSCLNGSVPSSSVFTALSNHHDSVCRWFSITTTSFGSSMSPTPVPTVLSHHPTIYPGGFPSPVRVSMVLCHQSLYPWLVFTMEGKARRLCYKGEVLTTHMR